jgi:hypothetical protein
MIDLRLGRYALGVCAVATILAGCGGSPPMAGTPIAGVQPATHSGERSFHGYYLAKFTTVVGSGGPSSFCFRFMPSGRWYSIGSTGGIDYYGTYLTAGKELFASAVWPASAALYMSLQGSVNAKQGSGEFIIGYGSGGISGGGTFTMTGKQNKSCS